MSLMLVLISPSQAHAEGQTGALHVVVVTPDSSPTTQGTLIFLDNLSTEWLSPGTSEITIDGLAVGAHQINALYAHTYADIQVSVTAGSTTDATVALIPWPVVSSGVLTDSAGAPVPGATISGSVSYSAYSGRVWSSSDDWGHYAPQAPPGVVAYEIQATSFLTEHVDLNPYDGHTQVDDVTLLHPSTATGRIHASDGQTLTSVVAYPVDRSHPEMSATVADDGTYALAGLYPGTYRIAVPDIPDGLWYLPNTKYYANAQLITVPAEGTVDIGDQVVGPTTWTSVPTGIHILGMANGVPKSGQTLSVALDGTFSPAPTSITYEWLGSSRYLGNQPTLKLTQLMVNQRISVHVTFDRDQHRAVTLRSLITPNVVGVFDSGVYFVSDQPGQTPHIGMTLSAATGEWAPAPVAFTFQWVRSGIDIPGATARSYLLTASDVGKSVWVRITASKLFYETKTITSPATGSIDGFTLVKGSPLITGTNRVGKTMAVNPGTWGPTPVILSYQWTRNGAAIPGATARCYTMQAADNHANVSVRVTGTKSGYNTVTVAAPVWNIQSGIFDSQPAPVIAGIQRVSYTLTANPGTWAPTPTLTYQWYRNGVVVTGATGKSYKLTTTDRGKRITVRVTARRPGYATAGKTSASTGYIR